MSMSMTDRRWERRPLPRDIWVADRSEMLHTDVLRFRMLKLTNAVPRIVQHSMDEHWFDCNILGWREDGSLVYYSNEGMTHDGKICWVWQREPTKADYEQAQDRFRLAMKMHVYPKAELPDDIKALHS